MSSKDDYDDEEDEGPRLMRASDFQRDEEDEHEGPGLMRLRDTPRDEKSDDEDDDLIRSLDLSQDIEHKDDSYSYDKKEKDSSEPSEQKENKQAGGTKPSLRMTIPSASTIEPSDKKPTESTGLKPTPPATAKPAALGGEGNSGSTSAGGDKANAAATTESKSSATSLPASDPPGATAPIGTTPPVQAATAVNNDKAKAGESDKTAEKGTTDTKGLSTTGKDASAGIAMIPVKDLNAIKDTSAAAAEDTKGTDGKDATASPGAPIGKSTTAANDATAGKDVLTASVKGNDEPVKDTATAVKDSSAAIKETNTAAKDTKGASGAAKAATATTDPTNTAGGKSSIATRDKSIEKDSLPLKDSAVVKDAGKDTTAGKGATAASDTTGGKEAPSAPVKGVPAGKDGPAKDAPAIKETTAAKDAASVKGTPAVRDTPGKDVATIEAALTAEEAAKDKTISGKEAAVTGAVKDKTTAKDKTSSPSVSAGKVSTVGKEATVVPNASVDTDTSAKGEPTGKDVPATKEATAVKSVANPLPNILDGKKSTFSMPAWFGGKKRGEKGTGGEKVKVKTEEACAVDIQKTWRGKSTRKGLWRQQLAAIDIQRMYRGMKEFKVFPSKLFSRRETEEEKKQRKERLNRIKTRERDFALLSTKSPESLRKFQELQNNRSARTIQTAWREKKKEEYTSRTDQHARRSGVKWAKGREEKQRGSVEVKESSPIRNSQLSDAMQKLSQRVQQTLQSNKLDDTPPTYKSDFSSAEHALKLTYLHQRIREQANQRIDNENKAFALEGGMRRQYQSLVQAQQKASLLLNDYKADYPYLKEDQNKRYESLHHCQSRVQFLAKPPSLLTMKCILNTPSNSTAPLTAEQTDAKNWLAAEYLDFQNNPKHQELLSKAMANHLEAKEAVLNTAKWSSVYLPNLETDGDKNLPNNIQTHYLHTKQSSTSFKHLAGDWADGKDTDESLQWVTYACQKSNVVSDHLQSSVVPRKEQLDLLKNIYTATYASSHRKQRLDLQYQQEKIGIEQLSKAIYDEYCIEARGRLKLYSLAKKGTVLSAEQLRLKAITKVQAYARRWLARKRLAQIQAQQRVMQALQTLLVEISNSQPGSKHNVQNNWGDFVKNTVPNLVNLGGAKAVIPPTPPYTTGIAHNASTVLPNPPSSAKPPSSLASPSIFRHTAGNNLSSETSSLNVSSTTRNSTHPSLNPLSQPTNSQYSAKQSTLSTPVSTIEQPNAVGTDLYSRLQHSELGKKNTPIVPSLSAVPINPANAAGSSRPQSSETATNKAAAKTPLVPKPAASTPIPSTNNNANATANSPVTRGDRVRFSLENNNTANNTGNSTPVKSANTPLPSSSAPKKNTPHSEDSLLLSPFLGLATQDDNVDYVSSPSHSHSLSRSLTASFGLVDGANSLRSSLQSALNESVLKDKMFIVPSEQIVSTLVETENRFKSNRCDTASLVTSSLQADGKNFRKAAGYDALGILVDTIGAKPLLSYLQRFANKKPLDATLSADSMEMEVKQVALLCCEMLSLIYTNDQRHCNEDEVHSLIQLCLLFRLLSEQTTIRLAHLAGLLEDLWLQKLPSEYLDIFLVVAKVRAYIVKKASKKASNPMEVCSSIIAQEQGGSKSNMISLSILTKVIMKLCPAHVYCLDSSNTMSPKHQLESAGKIAQLLTDYVNWEENTTEASQQAMLAMLCSLPSFRNVQKKLSYWFSLVPSMLDSVLVLFPTGQANMTEFTLKISAQSQLPLCMAEARLLAHLLARKGTGTAMGSSDSMAEEESAAVDVMLLKRIQVGEILQYSSMLEYVLLPNGMIQDRIKTMVDHLAGEYQNQPVHFLCVLKGSAVFFGDILRYWMQKQEHLHLPTKFDYIRVKSYEGTNSTGRVQITTGELKLPDNQNIVIVEDIIDTGLTMQNLVTYLRKNYNPKSIKVVSLLEKRTGKASKYKADYVGFSIPDLFVVGYGMDFNEEFRDIRHLAVLNKFGYESYKE